MSDDRDDRDREDKKPTEQRTDLAEDRTVLANERTFASWFRTGFAAVGIGLAFQALFLRMEPTWVPKAIATVFLAIGFFIFVAAERRACQVMARLKAHEVETFGIKRLRLMTIVACFAAVALTVAMWVLRFEPEGS